jgi:hypothetical protein
VLHACEEVDSVTLSSVFGDVGVYEVDDIGSDSDTEDSGEDDVTSSSFNDVFAGSPVGVVDMHNLSVDHGDK